MLGEDKFRARVVRLAVGAGQQVQYVGADAPRQRGGRQLADVGQPAQAEAAERRRRLLRQYVDRQVVEPAVQGGAVEAERAVVRPWLQAFTATWVPGHISYNGTQIREQIQAVYDAGYEEWILWNATNRYSAEGLLGADEVEDNENNQ